MGVLTESMKRLRDGIVSSRHDRLLFQRELAREAGERCARVAEMCAGFAGDRAGARRAWFGPTQAELRAVAEREQQRQVAEAARAKAQEEQRRQAREARARAVAEAKQAAAEAKQADIEAKQVAATEAKQAAAVPAPEPPAARSPRARKTSSKGSKKH